MFGIGTGEGSRSKNVLPARFGTVVQINKFLTMQDITDKSLEIGFHLVGKTSIEPLFEWKREVEKRIDEDLIPGEAWSGRNLQFTPGKSCRMPGKCLFW